MFGEALTPPTQSPPLFPDIFVGVDVLVFEFNEFGFNKDEVTLFFGLGEFVLLDGTTFDVSGDDAGCEGLDDDDGIGDGDSENRTWCFSSCGEGDPAGFEDLILGKEDCEEDSTTTITG